MSLAEAQIDPQQSIGQIAVSLPGATAIFRKLKLDFCCGGQLPLAQVVADKQLNLDVVVKALSALERSGEPPAPTDPAALIEHILTRYHAVHREQLPELIAMARRVEAVHKGHPDVPAGLADLLEDMAQYLESHMAKEEQVLFPLLTTGGHDLAAPRREKQAGQLAAGVGPGVVQRRRPEVVVVDVPGEVHQMCGLGLAYGSPCLAGVEQVSDDVASVGDRGRRAANGDDIVSGPDEGVHDRPSEKTALHLKINKDFPEGNPVRLLPLDGFTDALEIRGGLGAHRHTSAKIPE